MMRGFKVIATDIARVLPTLTCNLDSFANAFEFTGSATVLELSWTGEKTPVEGPGSIIALQTEIRRWSDDGYADLIICSDCCYNSSMIQPLMEMLSVVCVYATFIIMRTVKGHLFIFLIALIISSADDG